MKKTIQQFLLTGFIAISSLVSAQNPDAPKFISRTVPPLPVVLTETPDVKISFIDGWQGTTKAFSLVLENKSNRALTFSWVLKDKSGKIVGEARTTTLAPNATLDYSSKTIIGNSLVILLPENSLPSDYKVEIIN